MYFTPAGTCPQTYNICPLDSASALRDSYAVTSSLLMAASRGIGNGRLYSVLYVYFTFFDLLHWKRSSTENLKQSDGLFWWRLFLCKHDVKSPVLKMFIAYFQYILLLIQIPIFRHICIPGNSCRSATEIVLSSRPSICTHRTTTWPMGGFS